ncbi:MAG: HNH endonuclease [Myxococcales bacterium]|nr:HNH endonuclease [Myxococcales bacterium]MCB9732863.1 HNH endonuclease [Deltaproteobacteria bacterium]
MDTLLLGQGYEPLGRVGWQRAMTLWFTGRAEILEEYDDRVIRTVRVAFPMPAVVRFFRSTRARRAAVRFSREQVYARDHGRCQYCSSEVTRRESTYDHIVPRSRGGATRWDNIVLACRPCNQRKADRTPSEAHMALLSRPVQPAPHADGWRMVLGLVGEAPAPWRPYLGLE